MTTYVPPSIKLHTLATVDGSATYTSPSSTHTLVAGINYPLEVPYRSDEDPESTYIEVSFRPHNGVSMVRERYIEEIVRRTLQAVVLGEDTPRSMLQCTIQVLEVQEDQALPGGTKSGYQGEDFLDMVVGAVNASILGCLDGAVRMNGYVGAVLIGVGEGSRMVVSPSVRERKQCTSLYAFGFDTKGKCVLMESEGSFGWEEWESAESLARQAVCGATLTDPSTKGNGISDDVDMDSADTATCLMGVIRSSVHNKVASDERWKS